MESFWNDLAWVIPLRSDGLTAAMTAVTMTGYSTFYMVFLPFGLWLISRPAFARAALIVAFAGLTNAFLKDVFQDPRPDAAFALGGLVGDSYGMPSGHAQVATALWLWLAWEARRRAVWALAAVMIGLMAFSRLYLGVHDLGDVAAGLGLGVATVAAGAALQRLSLSWGAVALAALGAQAVIFALWPAGHAPGSATGYGAFAAAWAAGLAIAPEWRRPRGLRALGAGAVGLGGLMALYVGLSATADMIDPDGHRAMYVATLIVGLWMTAAAPALFRALRLTPR